MEVITSTGLSDDDLNAVLALCERAFEEDLRPYFSAFENPIHFIVRREGVIVGHACFIERWLQVGEARPLRTAYVEAVATEPVLQGQGIGSAVMRATMAEAERRGFEIGGLSPANRPFYERLGWEMWHGRLGYRQDGELLMSPEDEEAMVYRLSQTPALDLEAVLSIEWRPGDEVW